ncbi:hypothetical protein BGZ58_010897, partial [Dissophora ornata]
NEEVFLSGLESLAQMKAIDRHLRGFARALRIFYSVEENLRVARKDAEERRSRSCPLFCLVSGSPPSTAFRVKADWALTVGQLKEVITAD